MTLLEYYLNPGTSGINAGSAVTLLSVTQWKYRFLSARVGATGSSTVTTETALYFYNSLSSSSSSDITANSTTTNTSVGSEQYPAGNGNTYFSPLVNNIVEGILGVLANSASVTGNFIIFALELELDGDFDE